MAAYQALSEERYLPVQQELHQLQEKLKKCKSQSKSVCLLGLEMTRYQLEDNDAEGTRIRNGEKHEETQAKIIEFEKLRNSILQERKQLEEKVCIVTLQGQASLNYTYCTYTWANI